jgi:hypothetical protein
MPGIGKGYLTFAQNNEKTNYLELAYAQALSIKITQKSNRYAVVVDKPTSEMVTDKHRAVFEHIIIMDDDMAENDSWKLRNEWKALAYSPFYETIKIESDILLTTSIEHWWPAMQKHEVLMTTNILDYEGNVGTSRAYRRLFDDNNLPNVYSGFMYFRYSKTASALFHYAEHIYRNWEMFRDQFLVKCYDENPTTDVVFAIAAQIVGAERCMNPDLSYPTFTHMKGAINGWGVNVDWMEKLYSSLHDDGSLTVGFRRQTQPFHYFQKNFVTPELIAKYEEIYDRQRTGTS